MGTNIRARSDSDWRRVVKTVGGCQWGGGGGGATGRGSHGVWGTRSLGLIVSGTTPSDHYTVHRNTSDSQKMAHMQ